VASRPFACDLVLAWFSARLPLTDWTQTALLWMKDEDGWH
jgi:hypothetical protein